MKRKPRRLQRKRTRGYHLPAGTVVVTRPTRWGNPFPIGAPHPVTGKPMTLEDSLGLFRNYLDTMPAEKLESLLAPLRGKDLACYCKPGANCHAEIWLELANGEQR